MLVRIASGGALILPGAFIPAAERYDLMTPLDRWVVTHVCRHLAGRAGSRPVHAVNLSGMSLGDEATLDHIVAQLEAHTSIRRACVSRSRKRP